MGIKDVSGSLDDAGDAVVGLDLEDLAGLVGDDGQELQADVLRHHVENEVEGHGVLGTGGDGDVVADGRQVAEDGGRSRGVCGQRLGGHELAADEGDVDGASFVVGDVNEGLGGPAIDQLDAEDVGLGEGGFNVGLEVGAYGGLGAGARIVGLREVMSVATMSLQLGLLRGAPTHIFIALGDNRDGTERQQSES